MGLSDSEILDHIWEIQDDYWNGEVEANVALQEIRAMFRLRKKVREMPSGGPKVSGGIWGWNDDYEVVKLPGKPRKTVRGKKDRTELESSMEYPANSHPQYDDCDCIDSSEHKRILTGIYGKDFCSIPACGCAGDAHP